MKHLLLVFSLISITTSSFAAEPPPDCKNKDKVTASWYKECTSKVKFLEAMNGSKYKNEPCKCGEDMFKDRILYLGEKDCTVSLDALNATFMAEKFKTRCLIR